MRCVIHSKYPLIKLTRGPFQTFVSRRNSRRNRKSRGLSAPLMVRLRMVWAEARLGIFGFLTAFSSVTEINLFAGKSHGQAGSFAARIQNSTTPPVSDRFERKRDFHAKKALFFPAYPYNESVGVKRHQNNSGSCPALNDGLPGLAFRCHRLYQEIAFNRGNSKPDSLVSILYYSDVHNK